MAPMPEGSPRFRRDLTANGIQADGVAYVEVTDRRSATSFRLYDFEHTVALALDGRPLSEVAAGLQQSSGLDFTVEQLEGFVAHLAELGFLESAPVSDPDEMVTPVHVLADEPMPPRNPAAGFEPRADRAQGIATSVPAPRAAASPPHPGFNAEATQVAEPSTSFAYQDLAAVPPKKPVFAAPSTPLSIEIPPPEAETADNSWMSEVSSLSTGDSGVTAMPVAAAATAKPAAAKIATAAPSAPVKVPAALPAGVAAPPGKKSSSAAIYIVVALVVAAVVAFVLLRGNWAPEAPGLPVRTVIPSPGSVYRWFDSPGHVARISDRAPTWPRAGRVLMVAAAGTSFGAGDVLGLLDSGRRARTNLNRQLERLAFYTQLRATMLAEGNRAEARQAELKIALKRRAVDEARSDLAAFGIVATSSGVVVEPLATVAFGVRAGQPVLRLKTGIHLQGEFELSADEAASARQLGFCRVEIEGRPLDCALADNEGDATHVSVDLPADATIATNAVVRLAKARFDAVYAIPAAAVVRVGRTERVFVAGATGRAEIRAIALGDRMPGDAIVTQGLDLGDAVIVDVPPQLRPNARVRIAETRRQ